MGQQHWSVGWIRWGFLSLLAWPIVGACDAGPAPPGGASSLEPSPPSISGPAAAPTPGAAPAHRASAPPLVAAEFIGHADPATGELVVAPLGRMAWAEAPVVQDGEPGVGLPDTLELVTERIGSHLEGCGVENSFCGDVRVRSFFGVSLASTYVELTAINPASGNEGLNSVTPAPDGLGNTYGLWSYGSLGAAGSPTDSALATWIFRNMTESSFTFRGRVVYVPICGDGFVSPGETCDPPGSCPVTCTDNDPCTSDSSTGSAAACTLACLHSAVTSCVALDGCCPEGCDGTTDDDCAIDCRDDASWPPGWATFEAEVLAEINARRVAGASCTNTSDVVTWYPPVPELAPQGQLQQAARCHSRDMSTHDFFSHTGSDGSTQVTRVEAAGYTDWRALAENIAAGQATPAAAVGGWMASKTGHCVNIMSATYTELGVGYSYTSPARYRHYWTTNFGKR